MEVVRDEGRMGKKALNHRALILLNFKSTFFYTKRRENEKSVTDQVCPLLISLEIQISQPSGQEVGVCIQSLEINLISSTYCLCGIGHAT